MKGHAPFRIGLAAAVLFILILGNIQSVSASDQEEEIIEAVPPSESEKTREEIQMQETMEDKGREIEDSMMEDMDLNQVQEAITELLGENSFLPKRISEKSYSRCSLPPFPWRRRRWFMYFCWSCLQLSLLIFPTFLRMVRLGRLVFT